MTAIITGSGLGLVNSSLNILGQQTGVAALGRSGEGVYVNAATGNLVVQRADEILMGRGPDASVLRTYNSQGLVDGDNNDNWRIGFYRQIKTLIGTVNTAGSSVTRVDADGAELVYRYDINDNTYINQDGSGSIDNLGYNSASGQWTWTDGNSRVLETYDWISGVGKLLSTTDVDGNSLIYTYAGALLTRVASASGESTYLDYTGNNLTQIRTIKSAATTLTRVRYGYDASNRLTSVTVDLSPNDNSIADGKTYITSYTYDGTSKRVASITQTDGTLVNFTYATQGDGSVRIVQINQVEISGVNRITQIAYDVANRKTTVTDPLGYATIYTYDVVKRLTNILGPTIAGTNQSISYSYDSANGDVLSQTDARGNITTYQYDGSDNRILTRDAAGNTVTRTYGAKNELLTETVYLTPDPDGSGAALPGTPLTSRYAYDAENHLRFLVSAEGRVTEYRYNAYGQQISQLSYAANRYDLSTLTPTQTLSETTLASWVGTIDLTQTLRSDTTYDFRGQVDKITTYAQADAVGAGVISTASTTQYIYDQAGNLLQTIAPKGVATTGITTDFVTSYAYDGLGRLLSSIDTLGLATLNNYDDANNKTVTTLANGLATTRNYNKAGELISLMQADGVNALGTTRYSYDKNGRLRRVTDPTGVSRYSLYDEAGRKVADLAADGSLVEYTFNANNQVIKTTRYITAVTAANLTTLDNDISAGTNTVSLATIRPTTNINDRTTWNLYDSANRLAKTVDELGYITQNIYDGANRKTDVIRYSTAVTASAITEATLPTDVAVNPALSANDRRTRIFYDNEDKTLATLDAAGYLTESQYDAAGRLVHTIAYANLTNSTYWASGTLAQLKPATQSNDIHNWLLYNDQNQVIGSVDGEGYLTETTYDANGNKTQTIRYANKALITPQTITVSTTLAALRPPLHTQDQIASWAYTDLNQIKTATDFQDTDTQYTYDAVGRLIQTDKSVGTSEARTTRARYDKQGRLTGELTGEGSAALAALISPTQAQIDAVWASYGVTHAYDSAGRRISTTDQNGFKTLFYYNLDGNLTHTINALGETTETRYNALNQVTQTIKYGTRVNSTTLATLSGGLVSTTLTSVISTIANAALDSKTSYTYTQRGELLFDVDALGNRNEAYYNAFSEQNIRIVRIDASTTLVSNYGRDKRGILNKTTADLGGMNLLTTFTLDAFGRTTQITDPNGNVTQRSYDRLGRVVQTTDPLNINRYTTYDAFNRVLTQTDGLGNVTTTIYDNISRTTKIITPENVRILIMQNTHGQTFSVRDGSLSTTQYNYDKNGNLKSTVVDNGSGKLGLTTSSSFDKANRPIETVDANGTRTRYAYDAANRTLTKTLDPTGLNLITSYSYDTKGQTLTSTDANGVVTQTKYDLKGQVIEVILDPSTTTPAYTGLNLRTTYTYDARGKKLTVTEGAGTTSARTTQYVYDKTGRRTQEITDPSTVTPAYTGLNITTTYAYDKNDNLVTKTDARGNLTRYVYDTDNRLIYTVDALGGVTQNTYDNEDRVIKTQVWANAISLTSPTVLPSAPTLSDIGSRLVANAVTDQITQAVYDKDGRAIFLIDALSQVTQKTYDVKGNVIATTQYANTLQGSFAANAAPAIISATATAPTTGSYIRSDSNNDRITRFIFDAANRQVYAIDALGGVTENKFDANGNNVRTIQYANSVNLAGNPDIATVAAALIPNLGDRTTRNLYNKANRKVYSINPEGYASQINYSALGQIIQTLQYAQTIDVNDSDTLSTVAAKLSAIPATNTVVVESIYDKAGHLTDVKNGEGFVTRYVYDALGQTIDTIEAYGTASAVTTRRNYDKAGRVVDLIRAYGLPETTTTHYEYDALGNQTAETDPRGVGLAEADTTWALAQRKTLGYVDISGNAKLAVALTVSEKQALRNRYTSRTIYDNLGRKQQSTDALGGSTQYGYDAFGNLNKITDPRGNSGYFYYDKLNRRTWHADPEGYLTELRYNVAGQQTQTIRYANKASNTLSTATLPTVIVNSARDQITAFEYDRLGRKTKQTDAEGYFEQTTYDSVGNAIEVRNKLGGITRYTYDNRGLMLSETLPITSKNSSAMDTPVVNRYSYDARGNKTQSFEAFGLPEQRTTLYRYDKLDRLIQKQGTAVAVLDTAFNLTTAIPTETYQYDARGNRIQIDSNGRKSTLYYDALDRKVAEVDATGAFTTWVLDAAGNGLQKNSYGDLITAPSTTSIPTPVNATNVRTIYFSFDANNRATETWQIADNTYDYTLGLRSNAKLLTQNVYDANGNIVKITDPNGNTSYWFYDKVGNKTLQVDGAGYGIAWNYDNAGNITTQRSYAGQLSGVTRSSLNVATNPATLRTEYQNSAQAADDRIVTSAYDRMNRLTQQSISNVTYAGVSATNGALTEAVASSTNRTQYNGLGSVMQQTDANGNVTDINYDLLGRETQRLLPQFIDFEGALVRPTTQTAYNGLNLITSVTQKGKTAPDDRTQLFSYNANGARISQTDALGNITRFQLDVYGNIVRKMTYGTGNFVAPVVTSGFGSGGSPADRWFQLVDVNGDGRADAVRYEPASGTLTTALGKTDGTFAAPVVTSGFGSGGSPADRWFQLVDVNGDGRADAVRYEPASGTLTTALGKTDGTFAAPVVTSGFGSGGSPADRWFQLVDVNGDGRADAVRYEPASGTLTTALGKTDGTFAAPVVTSGVGSGGSPADRWFKLADVNGDGGADAVRYEPASGTLITSKANVNETRYSYDAANRQIRLTDVATGINQDVRYNTYGEITGKGVNGIWHETAEYDAQARVRRTNAGNGIAKAYMYDANGNATLSIESAGVDLATLSLVQMLNNSDAKLTFTRFDQRNQIIETIQPQLAFTHENAEIQAVQVPQANGPFVGALFNFISMSSLRFKSQPSSTQTIKLKHRPVGSTASFIEELASRVIVDGPPTNEWSLTFWRTGDFEYIYEAYDLNNKVLNRVSGQLRKGDVSQVLSQNPLALDPTYITQLQWIITSLQNQSSLIRQTQERNAFGEITAEIDGLGHRTDFTYNPLGKLTRKLNPETDITLDNGFIQRGRPETRYYYDLMGQVVGMQDANGNRMSQRYLAAPASTMPAEGESTPTVQIFDAYGNSKTTTYDIFGQTRVQIDELGLATRNSYDKNGNLIMLDRAGSNDDRYEYDSLGNRIAHTNALGFRETWNYDSLGRITRAASFEGRVTQYSYTWGTSATYTVLAPVNGLAAASGWMKRTTDANGNTLDELTDQYGRIRYKKDLGNHTTLYTYNAAGWLKTQTSSAGQNLVYDYYDNGYIKSIQDNANNSVTKYEYDKAGNRTFEGYTSIIDSLGKREFYQHANITYDELNRVKQVQDPKYQINYEYDANGNRRRVLSYYHDGVNGNAATQDYWYLYDKLNRFTITKGTLVGSRALNATDATRIQKGTTGVDLQYNAASERKVAVYGNDGHSEAYDYNVDGFLTNTYINGVLRTIRTNDALGRLVSYLEYNSNSTVRTNDTYIYDKDNKIKQQQDNLTSKGTNYNYLADGTLSSTVTYGDATTLTTTTNYVWWDSAKEFEIKIQASNQLAPDWRPGLSQFQYDVNGNLKQVNDVTGNRSLRYVINGEGLILKRDETVNGSLSKTHTWYYADSHKIGDVGNDGESQQDYAQILVSEKNVSRKDLYARFKPQNTANFDQNYVPINNTYPSLTSSSYVVRMGDTLKSIAQAVWGDASLWYLIADANGLTTSSTLTAGQNLVIPNQVTNIHNNSTTFKVYSPGEAIGDTSPTLPDAPQPPQPAKKKKGCGVLGTIIVIVVAIVATVLTAGVLAGASGSLASVFSAGVSTLGAGISGAGLTGAALAGTAGASMLGVAGFAVAGAVGSLASQLVGMGLGAQEKLSWSQVAMGAISSVAGSASAALVGAGGGLPGAIGRAVTGNVINQGASIATGLQEKFSWRAVAASAVGAGVSYGMNQAIGAAQYGSADAFAKANTTADWGNTLIRETTSGFFSGLARQMVINGETDWKSTATSSFGNALGNAFVNRTISYREAPFEIAQPSSQATETSDESLEQNGENSNQHIQSSTIIKVRAGQTLSSIAKTTDPDTLDRIAQYNGLRSRHELRAGSTLIIPDTDTLAEIEMAPSVQQRGAAGATYYAQRQESSSAAKAQEATTLNAYPIESSDVWSTATDETSNFDSDTTVLDKYLKTGKPRNNYIESNGKGGVLFRDPKTGRFANNSFTNPSRKPAALLDWEIKLFGSQSGGEQIWVKTAAYELGNNFVGARILSEDFFETKGLISNKGIELKATADERITIDYLSLRLGETGLGNFAIDVSTAANVNAESYMTAKKGGPLGFTATAGASLAAEAAALKTSVIYESKPFNYFGLVEVANKTQLDGHILGIGASIAGGAGTLQSKPGFTFYGGAGITLGVGGKVKTSFTVSFPWLDDKCSI